MAQKNIKRNRRTIRFSDKEWKEIGEFSETGKSEFVREAVREKIEKIKDREFGLTL